MSQASDNKAKYLKPPSLQQIEAFVADLGVTCTQFEKFFGIATGTIKQIRLYENTEPKPQYERKLPAKFWHIIYEKIVPAYGSGFLEHPDKKIKLPAINFKIKEVTKSVTKSDENIIISDTLRDLLDD